MRRVHILIVALCLLTSAAGAEDITRESVLAQMNAHREAEGYPPLREESRLTAAADDRMRDMEELSYWAHVAPDGRSPFLWLHPRGYQYRYVGENLAAGFDSAEVMVQSWMESAGHRANIMSPDYTECGIAIIEGSTRGKSPGKSVVVLFARPQ